MARVKLDRAGVARMLRSAEVADAVHDRAEAVASRVRASGIRVDGIPGEIALPVETGRYVTDRAASSVTISHPSGIAVQAKHGVLTQAASSVGLDVSARR